jgi:hypothetical protein
MLAMFTRQLAPPARPFRRFLALLAAGDVLD